MWSKFFFYIVPEDSDNIVVKTLFKLPWDVRVTNVDGITGVLGVFGFVTGEV